MLRLQIACRLVPRLHFHSSEWKFIERRACRLVPRLHFHSSEWKFIERRVVYASPLLEQQPGCPSEIVSNRVNPRVYDRARSIGHQQRNDSRPPLILCLDRRVPTPEEITRHHPPAPVIYVGARPTDYSLRIVEPDPSWATRYGVLESEIRASLGARVRGIQHVGSTSVPELPAKPIIDIDLAVADPTDEAAYAVDLQALGYIHWLTEPDWHQHRLFKRLDEPRVHLHVFGAGCPEITRHRMFRAWLLAHPEDRERYAAAKRAAAAQLAATGDAQGALGFGMRYNAIKEPVVREIYQRMFAAAGLLEGG